MIRRLAAVGALTLLLVACSSGAKGQEVPVQKVADGTATGFSDAEIAVAIANSDKWWEEWRAVHQGDDPLQAPPLFDFSKVHLVMIGSQIGKGDYTMNVPAIKVTGSHAQVSLDVTEPQSGCVSPDVDSVPYQVYQVPPTVTSVSVSEHNETVDCR